MHKVLKIAFSEKIHLMTVASFSTEVLLGSNWEAHWKAIEMMRSNPVLGVNGLPMKAPVDELGATALAHSGTGKGRNLYDSPSARESFRFGTLIATMLSPQTKDAQTAEAFHRLQKLVSTSKVTGLAAEHCFIAPNLLECTLDDITQACTPVSFYKTKAKNIQLACERIVANNYTTTTYYHESSIDGGSNITGKRIEESAGIPTDIQDLLSYKGVGPKIAYLTFSIAWRKDEGICVDTHVHRLANRLRWVGSPLPKKERATCNTGLAKLPSNQWKDTSTPEKTRVQLQKLLPQSHWGEVNELLVGYGQTICSAKKPMCYVCTLRTECNWYNTNKASSKWNHTG